MEADCNESFDDFQKKKNVIRKISTQNKHVKKKKKICASQPISLSECTVNNNKDIKAESYLKEVYCTSSSKTTESSLNSGNETEHKIITESTCETTGDISSNEVTSSSKPVILSPNLDVGIYQEKKINNFECVKKYILNDAAVSPCEWTCVICWKTMWQQDMQSHFANCIKAYGHKESSVGSSRSENILSPLICDVCKWDITHLSAQERCEHINKCLDSKPINIEQDDSSTTQSTITITECPLCFRNCSTVEARLIHIKKCSKALGIDVPSVIVALQLQQKHTAERISLGLPPVQTRPAIKKTSEKLPKKVVPVPKSENDANIQLAKALSLSVQEETATKQQELEEFTDIDLLKFTFPKGTPLYLKPPKTEEKPGRKKKKNINKPVPVLLLRTDEERQKLLEERVSSIIIPQCQTESSEKESKFSHEKCPLWVLCGIAEEKMSYYVQDIREFVTPSELEAGSELRSLSQVPGHRIFTQQPCDYTFNYSQESEVNVPSPKAVLTIPSTQEMIDVIVNIDDDEVDSKQDHEQAIECLSTQQSVSDKNHGKHEQCAKENDGFFCEEYDDETSFNPVIDSLMTLVGSTWLSDVDIIVSGGETIPAHALLLKLRCPALQMPLNVSQEERMVLDWKYVSHDAASHFLHYIYTGIRKWPSSLNAEIEHLIEQCKMKPDEKINSKRTKGISALDGMNSFDDMCKRSFHEKSPHRNQFCTQFSSPNFVLKKQNSYFFPEGYSNQQDSGNACMISQKVNDIHTISYIPDSKDAYHSFGSQDDPDILVSHEIKPMSLERPVHVKSVMSVSNSLEHQSTSACSQDLFECETDDDKLCDVTSMDHFAIEKSSDTIKESSKLNDTSVKNDVISYKANKSCYKMDQDAKCSSTSNFESQKVLPERTITYSDVVITVEEPCNNNTKMSNGENSKDITESKSLTDKNDECRDGLYNCNDVLFISNNDDEDNNYIDAVLSPSPPQNCSNAPKYFREIPKDTCLARSPVSSVVASATKVGTLSPSHMSSNLNTLDISKISRIILRKNNSESSIAFSTPLSKTRTSAFSEMKLSASQVKKRIFGSVEELRTSHCNMQMQSKSASGTLSTTVSYFPQDQKIDKVCSPLHSPIVLSSDEEIVSAHLNGENEALTFQSEKIERNSNEFSPVSYSQVHSSQMKFESSDDDDDVELVPLHMRIANAAGEKCDDEDVQIIPLPSMDYMKSNEQTSVTHINICNGSPTPVNSTVENKVIECETPDHLLHSKKLPVSGIQISNSPVTPLPDYKGMVTPDIKMALRKYGIRALPKKKAVALLTHIYEETHPWVELEEEGPVNAHLDPSVSTDSCKASKKRKAIEVKHKISPCREPCAKKSKLKKDKVSKTSMKRALSEEDNVLSSSQSSRSDIEDMLEESYDELGAEICSQNTSDSTKTLLHDFIRTNNDLYSKVLRYEPLNLANLHQELKESGIKISSTQLMDFLDEECITFTLPRSEKYKKKQQARTQKFRKRMIAQFSQPNAQNMS